MALVNKVNIFLVEPEDFGPMNEVYETFFEGTKPVSSNVLFFQADRILTYGRPVHVSLSRRCHWAPMSKSSVLQA